MNNLMRTSTVLGLAMLGMAGCQSGETASETPPPPPAETTTTSGGYGGAMGAPPMGAPSQPSLSVAPAGGGKPSKAPKTSFDSPPDGSTVVPDAGQQMPGAGGMGGGAPAGKPKPIRPGTMVAKFRPDPFVSFVQFIIEKPPAYSLAVPDRLASPPKIEIPPDTQRPEDLLPLPQIPRRVAGVLYNGAITAILETGEPPNSETAVISPGAKVPSGVPGIPELTVDSIAMDRLVLRAEDGRTVEVKLSALPPSVQDSLRQQFGSGGAAGGGFTGGGGPSFGGSGPGGFGGSGPRGGRGGAMMGGGGGAGLQ